MFSINLDVEEAQAHDAIRACLREVERVRARPVHHEELERARANFLASEHFERESVSGLASKLGNFEILGQDWRSEARYFETLEAATVEDLQRVALHYLDPKQLTVGVLQPETSSVETTPESLKRAVAAGIEESARATSAPDPTHSDAVPTRAARAQKNERTGGRSGQIVSYALENGAQLHVKPRRDIPVVAVRAAFLGGLLAQMPLNAGICHFLSSTWTRGTETHSAAAFARAVEDIASEIEGFSGRSSLGLTLEVATDQLEPSLDLFAQVLLAPGFDPDEIEKQRRETLAVIERMEDQLSQLVFALFARTHYDEHPYRLPMIGTRDTVAGFDRAALRAHHDRLIVGNNLSIAVAGDVDPDDIAAAITKRLEPLPAGRSFSQQLPAHDQAPSKIRQGVLHKDRAQAHLVLGFRGLSVMDADRPSLDVISQLLAGQSGRLFLELRDKRSLAYSVNAISMEGYAPGFFVVYIATAPDKLEDARAGMLEQLTGLVQDMPSAQELDHAKRNLIGNHAISQQRNAGHAAHMALDGLYGLGPGADQHYAEKIAAVTRQDIARVARRVVTLDAYTEALVAP